MKAGDELPPGFRFHPTDEELIMYYLRNQATSRPCPVSIIAEVDIYKFDPWQLPEKSEFGENEWYFFTPRDRKYPNGLRPNRATVSGYWKATGNDKAIYSASKYVGVKKALVFYKGRPPKGAKSDWIMHEYRLTDLKKRTSKQDGSMRLDDWVLCRIYKKKNTSRNYLEQKLGDDSPLHARMINTTVAVDEPNETHQMSTKPMFPRTSSLTHLLELDYWAPLSHLLYDGTSYNMNLDQEFTIENGGGTEQKILKTIGDHHNWMKLEAMDQTAGSALNQFPDISNTPVYEFH